MIDKKIAILDGFHNVAHQLIHSNLLYNNGNPTTAVFALQLTKKYIDELIKEIEDD